MIHLLLVDDQTLVRQGFRVLLEAHPDLLVVGEAENGQQALEQVKCSQPDVVLMDVRMPELDGVAATQLIKQQFPETKVLVLSTFNDEDYVARAMQYGAVGYLLKDTDAQELAQAIRLAHRGYTQLGPGLFEKAISGIKAVPTPEVLLTDQPKELPPELKQLTPREREVLGFLIAGATNRHIAETLYISERTVKNHVTSILGRLNLHDRIQAAIFASPYLPLLKALSGSC
ncbi:MAG: response regulator transcription factor [Anaerolineae bacterium]|nr:response regulator transcription factor [Gloeobacterales cyanobacterium ES-bin-313]